MIKPTSKQLEFMEWEMGAFFHFGIRTFYEGHKDWDGREMPAEGFNPTHLDCEQWIRAIKEGGAKYAILTTKHHDGFANWPSKCTEYSVKNTPWKNGKGDVVREFVDACRKYDVKVGLYYSPAQVDYKLQNPGEYDDFLLCQLTELLQNYGKIDYLWFDGCGSENHEYDKERIVSVIRGLQPEVLIFNMWDPDVRWVGNEEGMAPLGTKNVISTTKYSINETEETDIGEKRFMPYECECMIRRNNWFYSDFDLDQLRSLDELLGLYYYSVGRGGNLVVNFAPNREGLLPKEDCELYIQLGNEIKRRFSSPIPFEAVKEGNTYKLKLDGYKMVNHVVLQENLADGESIEEFRISNFVHVAIPVYEGKTVGHKQICRFPSMYTKEIHVEITKASGSVDLKSIALYYTN